MLFSSVQFLLSLPVAIAILASASLYSRRALLVCLILVSLIFYGWFRAEYTLILIGSAIGNFVFAAWLERYPDKRLFALGIALNVLALVTFKYLDFMIDNAN